VADDVKVGGANQLAALTRRLKAAGAGGLKRDLLRGLREGTKPMVEAARASALENLPKHGGLNQVVASSKIAVRTRTSGGNPGVRVVALSKHNIAAMDRGRLRHPTYGHEPWVTQQIRPGWWTDALMSEAPTVRRALLAVLHETAEKVAHG
jgi:hypothetical protein